MKMRPGVRNESSNKWKWVILAGVVLTLAAGAWLFALPGKEPPVRATAPVRNKIQPLKAESQVGKVPAIPPAVETPADQTPPAGQGEMDESAGPSEADEGTTPAPEGGKPTAAEPRSEETADKTETPAAAIGTVAPAPQTATAAVAEPGTVGEKRVTAEVAATVAAQPTSAPPEPAAPSRPPVPNPADQPVRSVAAPPPPKSDSAAVQALFTLQVGAFRVRSNADGMVRTLEGRGYKPFVYKAEFADKDPLYMVRLGGFATRENAETALSDFKRKEAMTAVVVRSGQI